MTFPTISFIIYNVKSTLDEFYTPEVIFSDISLTNPNDKDNATHIDSLDLALSFDSLWN